MPEQMRLGVLGAARNVPFTVLQPIRDNPDLAAKLKVVGLASRDLTEADAFAREWHIPKAYASFEEMLADPTVGAVYNVLPVAVRCEWTIKALMAGKHVLSETPICNNAYEAIALQRAAEDGQRVLLEGSHPTCHPVTRRCRDLILSGAVGRVEQIELDLPVGHSLQGKLVCSTSGSLMALGCHGIAIIRSLAGEEPEVVKAKPRISAEDPSIDTEMLADMVLPSGASAQMKCSIVAETSKQPTQFTINGSSGTIHVKEWFTGEGKGANEVALEQFLDAGERQTQPVDNPYGKTQSTFYFQLQRFVDEVADQEKKSELGVGMPWDYSIGIGSPTDAVRNMAVIDACYRAAGMRTRSSQSALPAPYNSFRFSKL